MEVVTVDESVHKAFKHRGKANSLQKYKASMGSAPDPSLIRTLKSRSGKKKEDVTLYGHEGSSSLTFFFSDGKIDTIAKRRRFA